MEKWTCSIVFLLLLAASVSAQEHDDRYRDDDLNRFDEYREDAFPQEFRDRDLRRFSDEGRESFREEERFDDRRDRGDERGNDWSEEEERTFELFERALKERDHDTRGLRELIEDERLSKQDLYERFGKDDVLSAVGEAGVLGEFLATRDFRDGSDKYGHEAGLRYGPRSRDMMYGMLFRHIERNIRPHELAGQCGEPDVIVDELMGLLKARVDDFSSVCREIEEDKSQCEARVEQDCSRIGKGAHGPRGEEKGDELHMLERKAFATCPPDAEALMNVCVQRSVQHNEQRLAYVDELCEARWEYQQERIVRECEEWQRGLQCERDAFVEQCLGGMRPEDFEWEEYAEDKEYDERPYEEHREDDWNEVEGRLPEEPKDERHEESDERNREPIEEPGEEKDAKDERNEEHLREEPDVRDDPVDEQPKEKPASEPRDEPTEVPGKSHEETTSDGVDITGNVVLESYDDFVKQCERDFEEYNKPACEEQEKFCNREGYIARCMDDERRFAKEGLAEIRVNCRIESRSMMREAERRCEEVTAMREECFEEGSRHCEAIDDAAEQCRELFTESEVRAFLREEVVKRCELAEDITQEQEDADMYEVVLAVNRFATEKELQDIADLLEESERLLTLDDSMVIRGLIEKTRLERLESLPAVQRIKMDNLPERAARSATVKNIAKRLATLRDTGEELPEDAAYAVESEAADIVRVSGEFEELEEKEAGRGIGYRLIRFVGLMRQTEEEEIEQLGKSREKLTESIENLARVAAQIDEPLAKGVILDQADRLRQQQENIDELIAHKREKAKGFLRILG